MNNMTPIEHAEAFRINEGFDFSFVTVHSGSTNAAKKGKRIHWTFSNRYKTYVGGGDQYMFNCTGWNDRGESYIR